MNPEHFHTNIAIRDSSPALESRVGIRLRMSRQSRPDSFAALLTGVRCPAGRCRV